MNHEFRLADIGEGLEEAEIISWFVAVGDHVERDQPLIEVMTDKSNAELPAPVSGTIVGLAGAVGDIIHVGGLIAVIEDTNQTATAKQAATPRPPGGPVHTARPADAPPAPPISALDDPRPRPKASPSTRRAAAEQGIDLTTITGTGPGGRILLADLGGSPRTAAEPVTPEPVTPEPVTPEPVTPEPVTPEPVTPAAVAHVVSESKAPAPPAVTPSASTTATDLPHPVPYQDTPGQTVPLRGVRRVVAQNMARAWTDVPHIHAFSHIDAEPLLDMRTRLKETGRAAYERLTPLSFFVAAVARAFREHPEANASIDMEAETITRHGMVNIGIAVAAPQGLVVPVLTDAGSLSFDTLSERLTDLITQARQGTLAREHHIGGTVTISNFGSLGGEQAVPIIRAPESMIFGFGSIADRPFVIEEEVVARKTMHLVAGADHRLLDGDITTAVLNNIGESLTDPLRLVL